MNQEHFRYLERKYHGAPCNEYYQPRLKVDKGRTELIIPIRPDFFHGGGATHGSVYFKALDDACYFAVSSLVEDCMVLTASFNIYILRPISQGSMRAQGKVVMASPRLYLAEGVIFDDKDREIARGSGNFVPSSKQFG